MTFNHNRLKGERIAKGFTVEQMANELGINKGTYSKKENGKLPITVEEFSVIFKKLGLPNDRISIFFTHDVSEMETKQEENSLV